MRLQIPPAAIVAPGISICGYHLWGAPSGSCKTTSAAQQGEDNAELGNEHANKSAAETPEVVNPAFENRPADQDAPGLPFGSRSNSDPNSKEGSTPKSD